MKSTVIIQYMKSKGIFKKNKENIKGKNTCSTVILPRPSLLKNDNYVYLVDYFTLFYFPFQIPTNNI